jgi:hypothetical protein
MKALLLKMNRLIAALCKDLDSSGRDAHISQESHEDATSSG